MSLGYRDAGPADAAAIDALFRTAFCDTFAHLYAAEDLEAFLGTFTLDGWRDELSDPDYAFRIATSDGNPVGYVKLGPPALPVEPDAPSLELRQLYLLKPWQGHGLAQELMDWALGQARARGARELYLTVYVDNHRARKFYARYGFSEVGPYRFMVGNHADEDIIMKLGL